MNKKSSFWALMMIGAMVLLHACTDDSFKEIESDLLGDANYGTDVYNATVSINNIKEKSIQSNGLSGYLLGEYTQAPFGTKNASIVSQVLLASVSPTFGANTQATENTNNKSEEETVTEAYLYIPFYSTSSTGLNANNESVTTYTLDSIFGETDATFDLRVYESNYFLRDIDPTQNFNSAQNYYSDTDVKSNLGTKLADIAGYKISKESIKRYNFDNPTTDTDESTTELDELSPGIRIPLDAAFFQSKIIDREGSDELASLNAFYQYFRGIYIETDNFSDNLMMLLNLINAKIEVVYTYKTTVSDKEETMTSRYEMNLTNTITSGSTTSYYGIKVNLFDNTGDNITSTSGKVDNIYIGGGLGRLAEFTLFTDEELAQLRQERWLVNDASLTLYIDANANIATNPERLYLYNAETGESIIDYSMDLTANTSTPATSRLIHLGRLVKENDKGVYYELRLTNHIANIIRRDSTNVKLGLAVATNVNSVSAINYYDESGNRKPTSVTTISNPLSTVLHGNSNNVDEAKRVQLKINYTKIK